MSDDTSGWGPEDGAGYIPTEEGGSKAGCIPKSELRELIEEWRDHDPADQYDYQERIGLEIAAEELEALLDE